MTHLKKIAIIGISGAGKSYLARRLNGKLNLPLYHVDQFSWQEGWGKPRSNDDIVAHVATLLAREEWLIEGYIGYVAEPDLRLRAADLVIVLDYSRIRLAWHLLKRSLRYRQTNRPEMPSICTEACGLETIQDMWRCFTKKDMRKNLYAWIACVDPAKKVIFTCPAQLRAFEKTL